MCHSIFQCIFPAEIHLCSWIRRELSEKFVSKAWNWRFLHILFKIHASCVFCFGLASGINSFVIKKLSSNKTTTSDSVYSGIGRAFQTRTATRLVQLFVYDWYDSIIVLMGSSSRPRITFSTESMKHLFNSTENSQNAFVFIRRS